MEEVAKLEVQKTETKTIHWQTSQLKQLLKWLEDKGFAGSPSSLTWWTAISSSVSFNAEVGNSFPQFACTKVCAKLLPYTVTVAKRLNHLTAVWGTTVLSPTSYDLGRFFHLWFPFPGKTSFKCFLPNPAHPGKFPKMGATLVQGFKIRGEGGSKDLNPCLPLPPYFAVLQFRPPLDSFLNETMLYLPPSLLINKLS